MWDALDAALPAGMADGFPEVLRTCRRARSVGCLELAALVSERWAARVQASLLPDVARLWAAPVLPPDVLERHIPDVVLFAA